MSKIIPAGDESNMIFEFEFEDISGEATMSELTARAAEEFDPGIVFDADFPEEEFPSDFIPGGLTSDEEIGLTREALMERAKKEAEVFIAAAAEDGDHIRAEAYEKGYAEGLDIGYREGLDKTVPVITGFKEAIESLVNVRSEFYAKSEQEMIELVMAIARAVIGEQVDTRPATVRHVIEKAIERLRSKEELLIKVNPMDIEEAERAMPDLRQSIEDLGKVSINEDTTIDRGGCIVESTVGMVDAKIATQLDAIRESLVNANESSISPRD